MNYSYVMGIDKSIYSLEKEGFKIEAIDDNFCVSFPKEKSEIWENFIMSHLEINFWNEYLQDDKVIFLFHLANGFKRYVVENYKNNEVLELCDKLCDCNFKSIKDMLKNNIFYSDKIN